MKKKNDGSRGNFFYANVLKLQVMATLKQLQQTLQLTFGLVPIVAGIDKYTNLLTNWDELFRSSHIGNTPSECCRIYENCGSNRDNSRCHCLD